MHLYVIIKKLFDKSACSSVDRALRSDRIRMGSIPIKRIFKKGNVMIHYPLILFIFLKLLIKVLKRLILDSQVSIRPQYLSTRTITIVSLYLGG